MGSETATERGYIREEARRLFRKNKEVCVWGGGGGGGAVCSLNQRRLANSWSGASLQIPSLVPRLSRWG